ncbi:hypothetical protein CJ673_04340 [Aliarcobacter cryaerophilus]|uniref:GmrSD restriction endonucleases N-terminal domain-containing protein n=1 Tax=Aliarcobacter cryaerophilus TaxID=28198 RepID=A0A2S9T7H7_9BACT|nr:DUF262 domain-containing protein [Aliarcobacter cryaerophilus]PRM94795.1 hypothetical protein CJ673_04340 [Aliarcobacter cryaerophilus]
MAETTKTFLELIKDYKIIIPLIQRDYAQGREKEKNKAEKFLEAIKNGCESKLNLDFVYGKRDKENKIFIPLDGQQRLTTLFLIHWYLSLKNDYKSDLSKFSYEVRSSSKDFLEELTKNDNWKNFTRKNIKTQVENSNWFFLSWKKDLTVVSLLKMLDLIEKFFENEDINKLNNITFEILYLDEFNLTDELYVKMNARGKPLTLFENFKAEFESYIEKTGDSKDVIARNKASFDNEWLNIFWNLAKKKVEEKQINIDEAPKLADEMFYNFFYNITFNFYLEKQDKFIKINNKEYSIINEFIKDNDIFSFYKDIYSDTNKTTVIINILNKLQIDETFETFVNNIYISQWDRARFHALQLAYIYDLDEKEFNRWKRVSFNLINNQLIQSPDDLIKTIKSLNSFIEKSNKDIYEHIKKDYKVIDYFTQKDEESLKAKLILENQNWEEEIVKAECHWYLDGQIGFLLEFAENNLEKFIMYRDKFVKIWDSAKNEKKTITDNQILIYQALLVKGDYFINDYSEYKNRIFCSFAPALRTKFDNWRKLFNSENKKYLKELLDDNRNLKEIINEFNNTNDWRYGFIKYPKIFKYCKQYQIRMKSENNILLLSKERVYGEHAEYYTYWLKFELEKELEKELKYNFSSSTEDYKYLEIDENQKVIFKDGKWYLNEVEDEHEISKPKIENKEIKYEFIKNK